MVHRLFAQQFSQPVSVFPLSIRPSFVFQQPLEKSPPDSGPTNQPSRPAPAARSVDIPFVTAVGVIATGARLLFFQRGREGDSAASPAACRAART